MPHKGVELVETPCVVGPRLQSFHTPIRTSQMSPEVSTPVTVNRPRTHWAFRPKDQRLSEGVLAEWGQLGAGTVHDGLTSNWCVRHEPSRV